MLHWVLGLNTPIILLLSQKWLIIWVLILSVMKLVVYCCCWSEQICGEELTILVRIQSQLIEFPWVVGFNHESELISQFPIHQLLTLMHHSQSTTVHSKLLILFLASMLSGVVSLLVWIPWYKPLHNIVDSCIHCISIFQYVTF